MRSIVSILALATSLAAPMGAVAATPNTFTTPTNTRHQKAAPQVVMLTLVNYTSHTNVVKVGDQAFKVDYDSVRHIYAPVGSVVTQYSDTNSKANGLQLMTVTAEDRDKSIFLK